MGPVVLESHLGKLLFYYEDEGGHVRHLLNQSRL